MAEQRSSAPEATGEKQAKDTRFQPGQSGNPAGRPKGSRNKLAEDFVSDLHEDWKAGGKDAIVKVREQRPQDYLKVIAAIVPKELNLNADLFGELTADELGDLISALRSVKAGRAGAPAGDGAEETTRH